MEGLTTQALRERVRSGMCPWCERGPFRVLARHTEAIHRVTGRQLRELIGLPWTATICDPDVSERRRELNATPERQQAIRALVGRQGPQAVSPAGREVLRSNAAAIPRRPGRKRVISEETRAAVRAAVQRGEAQTEVARRHRIADSTVTRILHGRRPRRSTNA